MYRIFSLSWKLPNMVIRLQVKPEVTNSRREEAHHLRIKNGFFWILFLFVFIYFLKVLKVKIFCLLLWLIV